MPHWIKLKYFSLFSSSFQRNSVLKNPKNLNRSWFVASKWKCKMRLVIYMPSFWISSWWPVLIVAAIRMSIVIIGMKSSNYSTDRMIFLLTLWRKKCIPELDGKRCFFVFSKNKFPSGSKFYQGNIDILKYWIILKFSARCSIVIIF